jgi:hypothetical protein
MAMAALFVACKVEEVARPLDHVASAAWRLRVAHYGAPSADAEAGAQARWIEPVRVARGHAGDACHADVPGQIVWCTVAHRRLRKGVARVRMMAWT